MLILRQWRNIKELKQFGRGHDPAGIAGMAARWLYTLFLAQDACFKQKARQQKHNDADPQLSPGLGVVVDPAKYSTYMSAHPGKQSEISGCSSFSSIDNANSMRHKGCHTQGIGVCSCARHESYLSVGDLPRGKAYAPMDYIFLYAIMASCITTIVMSYDIACQWWKNFYDWIDSMPEDLKLPQGCTIQFHVPKLHLIGHTEKCRPRFSFNYTPNTGITDGEGVEQQWVWLNEAAPSLSLMCAGGRWDALNDLCNYWNWLKTKNLLDDHYALDYHSSLRV
ncbi:hypothetical protein GYMLUDRAFT_78602 [Collybiopsis luxurians FD-317 M1]|uniref:CxC2-like cysteine cluster KDZ transposase-associated domain-containing protein n=1 Tax=Collybiopsis luxurians FD-317 M1 TaxID=944289 RepID=A0A0D0B7D6_9AGAR|nr:hypothetical protein GYMLUDRAFT_78602 [Collybiopsis luxurians FD-317 M1]